MQTLQFAKRITPTLELPVEVDLVAAKSLQLVGVERFAVGLLPNEWTVSEILAALEIYAE